MLEKSVAEKCWEGSCCREVLGKIVVEKCWRSRTVLEKGVGEKCCRGVLETVLLQVKNQHLSVQLWALCCCVVGAAFTVTAAATSVVCDKKSDHFKSAFGFVSCVQIFFASQQFLFVSFVGLQACAANSTELPTM